MKKIIETKYQLREVLRNIILTQDESEINNFNSLYDYSEITDMTDLWAEIKDQYSKNEEKIDWKNIKFPTLDMSNIKECLSIFHFSPLYEINLINTENIKNISFGFYQTKNLEKISLDLKLCEYRNNIFYGSNVKEIKLLNTQNIRDLTYGFQETKKLEKVNDLYLDNCENIFFFLKKSNLKKINLYNTNKINDWTSCFENSNIEEIELDVQERMDMSYFLSNSKIKKINLKNCEHITNLFSFIKGNSEINYLKINLSNVTDMRKFIDERNNIKYLEITGIEEYLKNNIKKLKRHIKDFEEKIEELEEILKRGIDIEKDFCEIFFSDDEIKDYYQNNPIPYINLVKLTKKTNYDIIANDLEELEIKKILKEKQKKENNEKIKIKKLEEIKNIQKEICEINL